MRKLLAAAVALAPLALAAGAAQAQVVIDDTRTTPIQTSTADDGDPADVTVDEDGAIELDEGVAITLDSDNDVLVENGGVIQFEDAADGATGILAQGGSAGSITMNGSLSVTEDYTVEDDDEDGDLDGPFAEGSDRYGIRVTGAAPLDGDINLGRQAVVTVEGNESYGVRTEVDVTGDLVSRAAIGVTGDNSYGVRSQGAVGGDMWIGGSIAVQGENSIGLSIEGDVDGALRIDSSITTTGYRYTSRPSNEEALEGLDPDDLLIGGAAVHIGADVAGGVLLATSAPPVEDDETEDGDEEENEDTDNDGVPDSEQTTAAILSIGSAPAIEIGSTSNDVTLGLVGEGDAGYGFINRGAVTAAGVYDNVNSTAIRVGVEGGQTVLIEGGLRNEGDISATAIQGDATGLHVAAGATTPVVHNQGTITSNIITDEDNLSSAFLIGAGGEVGSFYNSGTVQSDATGSAASTVAIRDLSGSLNEIDNIGVISASVTATADEDGEALPLTGDRIAIDVSANTSGVTLTQLVLEYDPENPPANNIITPIINGDILLGSGADTVDIRDGYVNGDIDFGSGADSLIVSGDAIIRGALSSADGQLSIDVQGGILDAQQEEVLDIANLSVGEDGALVITVDPANDAIDPVTGNASAGFKVSGSATFADGAGLGVRFTSLVDDPTSYLIVEADDLTFGEIDQESLTENSPYLFAVEARGDEAAGQVFVDVRRRTAEEIGMIASEASAYDAVYEALNANDELREAFLNQNDRESLLDVYEQMLPDHSGGALISLATGVDAVTRALAGRNNSAARGETSAWLQEINFYADKETNEAYGFKSEGFGLAGGVERGTRLGAIGVSTAFTSSDLEDPSAAAEERLSASLIELGLYWRAQGGAWTTWARAAGGYATFESVRQFVGEGVLRRADADWNGYTVTAAAGASYERNFGRYSLRPEVIVEYFGLNEDGFQETGGGDGFDLAVEDREGHIFSSTAALNFGMGFGENQWLRPEVRVGWRQIISHDGGVTTARFLSGGPAFDLAADSLEGGGAIVGLRLNVGNELGMLAVEADAEFLDDYVRYALLLRASFRF